MVKYRVFNKKFVIIGPDPAMTGLFQNSKLNLNLRRIIVAKIYAIFTKFIWAAAIFASLLAVAQKWIQPSQIGFLFIGFIILLILTFPALAITDLSNQVEQLKKLVGTSSNKKIGSSEAQDNVESKSNNLKDGYKIVEVNQKKFAVVKDGNPDNFYCPHCYSQVNPKSDSCYNCKHNFKEDIVQDDVTSSEAQNNVESESNSVEVWVCSKCGESNPIGTMFCRRCGK